MKTCALCTIYERAVYEAFFLKKCIPCMYKAKKQGDLFTYSLLENFQSFFIIKFFLVFMLTVIPFFYFYLILAFNYMPIQTLSSLLLLLSLLPLLLLILLVLLLSLLLLLLLLLSLLALLQFLHAFSLFLLSLSFFLRLPLLLSLILLLSFVILSFPLSS